MIVPLDVVSSVLLRTGIECSLFTLCMLYVVKSKKQAQNERG